MRRILPFLLLFFALAPSDAQQIIDRVAQAMAQGDLYQSRRRYELALEAYRKADKLSNHSSAACYLKLVSIERKLGDFSAALNDAKHAVQAAGENKGLAVQAHLVRATVLAQMAGKPTDRKLKEAEDELRQALALDSNEALAHYDLGMVLLKQERDQEGLAELNTFAGMPDADSETIDEVRRVIANPIRARAPFAPDFSFTTHQDQSVSNEELRGKVVLLDFWGTWCPPCRASVPILRNLQKKYSGKDFQLVGISSDEDEDVWSTFVAAHQMDWLEYIDLSGKVLRSFKIESFPTYIVLDKDGVIRFRQSGLGEFTQGDLEEAINKALKRQSDPKLAAGLAAEATATAAAATGSKEPGVASSPGNASAGTSASKEESAAKEDTKPSSEDGTTKKGIEDWTVSGNVYKNPALGMTFQFPQGWDAANVESLRAINDRTADGRAAVLQQHPELTGKLGLSTPKMVFYSSRKG
jgi:thiol-disulfide isomerase/thioredoxin